MILEVFQIDQYLNNLQISMDPPTDQPNTITTQGLEHDYNTTHGLEYDYHFQARTGILAGEGNTK